MSQSDLLKKIAGILAKLRWSELCGACPEYSRPGLDAFCALMSAARTLLEKQRKG